MYLVLVILLILLLLGGLPQLGLHQYGWAPSGSIGLILLIIVVVLVLRGGL